MNLLKLFLLRWLPNRLKDYTPKTCLVTFFLTFLVTYNFIILQCVNSRNELFPLYILCLYFIQIKAKMVDYSSGINLTAFC